MQHAHAPAPPFQRGQQPHFRRGRRQRCISCVRPNRRHWRAAAQRRARARCATPRRAAPHAAGHRAQGSDAYQP
eukprot:356123-Chlamydomonas_euryale.AAC.4